MNRILIFAAAAAAGTALALPSPAAAADGREFGEHVVHCAQDVGFSGTHNPGMHQGFHGFTDHECVMA
ncbi:hypothetical protein [Nocardioides luteus]|uniref:Uncharacterized protein n=1 Tax=Nocardioides luteus TaxID=1844 RepID=A0A1J4N7W5_9ACTN|nr:hypothetical protein [Nocardioides luteus]OIJ27618.1 hypothetical protein UG56_006285 [Nocardioides luteus]